MAMRKVRAYVLVKAYPQPSVKYEETVCCAGITDDGQFVRLYPIRYRRLPPEAQFGRFDLIEFQAERPHTDARPESLHVDEQSIRILHRGDALSSRSKAELWLPHVSESLPALRNSNQDLGVSLGIVKPDTGSVRFSREQAVHSTAEDAEITQALIHQTSLIESPLRALDAPEYAFYYRYKSGGATSKGQIHDWEVQAAFVTYKRRYGELALDKMREAYERDIPAQSLHLILGTMRAHPRQFIIIGLLRTTQDTSAILAQGGLI